MPDSVRSLRTFIVDWCGQRSRLFVVTSYLVGGAVIFKLVWNYYRWYWGTYESFNRSIEFCEIKYCDFVLYYWEQAKVISTARAPIAKYFYSPTFALLLTPFRALSQEEAIARWTWVQALSLVLYVGSSLALLRKSPWWSHAALAFLVLTSYPVLHNWKWGQANTLFTALALTSYALVSRRWLPAVAAFPLSLASSARYFPALYGAAFLRRTHWKVTLYFLGLLAALLVLLPAVVMGGDAALDFYRASAEASRFATTTWVVSSTGSQFLPTVLARRGAELMSFDLGQARGSLTMASYALAAFNVYSAVRCKEADENRRHLWAFCFLGGSTPLLLPTSWMHYFVFLPASLAFLLGELRRSPPRWPVRALLFALLWLPSAWLSSIFFFNRCENAHVYSVGGYLLGSTLLMLTLAHVLVRSGGASVVPLPERAI